MKKIELSSIEKYKKKKTKHSHPWKEVAEEMTNWFGETCYWIFHKFPEKAIRTEFGVCKQEGIYDRRYLLFKLNNLKKTEKQLKEERKKRIASKIIDDFESDKKDEAMRSLKLARGIIGDKAYHWLLEKMEPDTLKKAQNIFGGKIIKK